MCRVYKAASWGVQSDGIAQESVVTGTKISHLTASSGIEVHLKMLYKKFCRKSCAKGSFPGALRELRLEGLEVVAEEKKIAKQDRNGEPMM